MDCEETNENSCQVMVFEESIDREKDQRSDCEETNENSINIGRSSCDRMDHPAAYIHCERRSRWESVDHWRYFPVTLGDF